MRVLLFGGAGMVGRATAAAAPAGWSVAMPTSVECDIRDAEAVNRTMVDGRPEVVINAAAYTAVDNAEDEPAAAHLANTIAPGILAAAARDHGARLVHISTDYVFDGAARVPYTEDAAVNPASAYAKSKLGGERAVLAADPSALVVRTQWVFGPGGKSLVVAMRERAERGEGARVVTDQRGRPTYAPDLARALVTLAARPDVTGILHVANDGQTTAFDLARAVYAYFGHDELVTPVTSAEFGARAARPAYSVLALGRLFGLGMPMRHWRDALMEYLGTSEVKAST